MDDRYGDRRLKNLAFKKHETLSGALIDRLLACFSSCVDNNQLTEVRAGDERIFYFEKFLDTEDSGFLFTRHLDYCDSIGVAHPSYMTLMINRTWYDPNALGSGAGWHRDSGFRDQHKTFSYLSDVGENNGPFVIYDHSNYWLSLLDNPRVRQKNDFKLSIKSRDVIFKKIMAARGYSFSCCTNFIHRGLPVGAGERYMVTVYSWNELPPEPFTSYFS